MDAHQKDNREKINLELIEKINDSIGKTVLRNYE